MCENGVFFTPVKNTDLSVACPWFPIYTISYSTVVLYIGIMEVRDVLP